MIFIMKPAFGLFPNTVYVQMTSSILSRDF